MQSVLSQQVFAGMQLLPVTQGFSVPMQRSTHRPWEQGPPTPQLLRHWPQLAGSVFVSTHWPPHDVSPPSHVSASAPEPEPPPEPEPDPEPPPLPEPPLSADVASPAPASPAELTTLAEQLASRARALTSRARTARAVCHTPSAVPRNEGPGMLPSPP